MKKNSLFLCDIDGTLVGDDFLVRDKVKKMIQNYQQLGGTLVLCTGRSWEAAKGIYEELKLRTPAIVYNGAGIYDSAQEKLIWCRPIDSRILKEIPYIYQNFPNLAIQIFTEKEIYLFRSNTMLENYGVPEERGKIIHNISQVSGKILKLSFTADHRAELQKCKELPIWKKYRYEYSSHHFSEVIAQNTGKHIAAKKLLEILRVQDQKIFAAGNGDNDLELLRMSDCSFAPRDAVETIRKASNLLIPSAKKGGIKQAFWLACEYHKML